MNDDKLTLEIIERGNIYEIICAMQGGGERVKIKLPDTKDSDIIVGKKFYYLDTNFRIDKITITYVRSGIVFYKSKLHRKGEHNFPLDCLFARHLKPEIYETDLDPKYYEIVCPLGKTKVKYIKNEKGTLDNTK
jgi:hypothetical protein